jgi:hypothetical protein
MTSGFKLYIADATTMSIGNLSGVEFVFVPSKEGLSHCRVASIKASCDQYGDQVLRVEISFVQALGIPIRKFRLRHPSGETGFDSISVPTQMMDTLLKDSYLVTDRPDVLQPASILEGEDRQDPMQIFAKKGAMPMMITYMRPDRELRSLLDAKKFSNIDAVANINLLIESVHLSEAVFVWSWAYGLNPILLSANSRVVIASLQESFESEFVEIREVESERMLPEW